MFERCVCVGLGAHTDVSYQTVRRLRSFLWQCKSKQSRWRNARCKRKSSETTNNLNVSLSSLAFLTNYSHMQHAHTHARARTHARTQTHTGSSSAISQLGVEKRKKRKGPLPYSPCPRCLNRKLPDASLSPKLCWVIEQMSWEGGGWEIEVEQIQKFHSVCHYKTWWEPGAGIMWCFL